MGSQRARLKSASCTRKEQEKGSRRSFPASDCYVPWHFREQGKKYAPGEKGELAFDRGERLCLARMVRGQREPFGSAESVADVMDADEDGLALEDALRDVDALAAYVKARRAANEDVDPKVARALNEALAALPKIEDAVARGALRAETRDVLMVSYLAGVTKAQLAIGAKLHESF